MTCLRSGGLILGLFLLGGCASVSVRSVEKTHHQPAPRLPTTVYVKNFATPEENFRVDRSGEALATFRQQLSERLSRQLEKRLDHNLISGNIVSRSFIPPSGNAWLIDGRFDRVAQGSRALRALLGFGSGGTKIETTAIVYDLSTTKPTPFLVIQTTGGSNAMPGAVANINPLMLLPSVVGFIVGAAGGAHSGLGFDANRTAREIIAVVSAYTAERGMIPPEQAMQPKMLGNVPLRLGDPARPVNQ